MVAPLRTFVHTGDRRYWGYQRHDGKLAQWLQDIKDKIPSQMLEKATRLGGGPNPAVTCVITFTGKKYIQYTRPQKQGQQDNHFFALEMADMDGHPFGTVFFVFQE